MHWVEWVGFGSGVSPNPSHVTLCESLYLTEPQFSQLDIRDPIALSSIGLAVLNEMGRYKEFGPWAHSMFELSNKILEAGRCS